MFLIYSCFDTYPGGWSWSDYMANSDQLLLQLPTGTKLGKNWKSLDSLPQEIYPSDHGSTAAEINFGINNTCAGPFFGCGGASSPFILR